VCIQDEVHTCREKEVGRASVCIVRAGAGEEHPYARGGEETRAKCAAWCLMLCLETFVISRMRAL